MKPYHEVAHIKDKNKITGYVVSKCILGNTANWGIVSKEKFEDMVKKDKVVYYTYDNKTKHVKLYFTDEEKQEMVKYGMQVIDYTLKEWYDNDKVYKDLHIQELMNNGIPIVSVINVSNVVVLGDIVNMDIFLPKTKLEIFLGFIKNTLGNSVYMQFIRFAGNNIRLMVPLRYFSETKVKEFFRQNRCNYEYRRVGLRGNAVPGSIAGNAGIGSSSAESIKLLLSDIRSLEKI